MRYRRLVARWPRATSSFGTVRDREETLIRDLDLGAVAVARRLLHPVGHDNRPDQFRLQVATSPRAAVVETSIGESRTPVS